MSSGVDFDAFLDWVQDRFDPVDAKGVEIKVNSIFDPDDRGQHLWCSPTGGRHNRDHGVFRCWKTGRVGTLAKLVEMVDGITYGDACEMLGINTIRLEFLDDDVAELFDEPEEPVRQNTTGFPEGVEKITDLPSDSRSRQGAEAYLKSRCLDPSLFWVGTSGKYSGFIIIPYFNRAGDLVYFSSRKYFGSGPRYLGPNDDGTGPPKMDWLYTPKWPDLGQEVYVSEGELNAVSIHSVGLPAFAAGGKMLSDQQIIHLSQYKPVICFDGDKKGRYATTEVAEALLGAGITDFHYCLPPSDPKLDDWNKMLVAKQKPYLRAYLERRKKPYSYEVGAKLKAGI